MRLNKFLQQNCGISRREADRLIEAGSVKVNGEKAHLGQQVSPFSDKIVLADENIDASRHKRTYILMNKPKGFICSKVGENTVYDILPDKLKKLFTVGRLDVATTGALLLTDDGELANALMRMKISRVYAVQLDKTFAHSEALAEGIEIDGFIAKIGKVKLFGDKIEIELFEGKYHEVRRIFEKLGYAVKNLKRVSFASLRVDELPVGKFRPLYEDEVIKLKKSVGKGGQNGTSRTRNSHNSRADFRANKRPRNGNLDKPAR